MYTFATSGYVGTSCPIEVRLCPLPFLITPGLYLTMRQRYQNPSWKSLSLQMETTLAESITTGIPMETTLAESITTGIPMETTLAESIVTDTLMEQVLTVGVLSIFWLYVNLVDGFIIFVIRTSNSLRENNQYPVLTGYIISDMLMCNLNMIMLIPLLIADDIDILPRGYCPVISTLIGGAVFTNIWMIGYLAFERYM